MHEIGHALGLDGEYSGFKTQSGNTLALKITAPRPFAGTELLLSNGPHIGGSGMPLMMQFPEAGARQLISGVDALVAAQLSSFDRPDLTEPVWDVAEDGPRTPKHRTIKKFSCPEAPDPNRGVW